MTHRTTDPVQQAMDSLLQVFIGDRETRPAPTAKAGVQVFRDFSSMEEIEPSMSNCDHSIDEGMDEQLRAKPGEVYSRHAGWNFNGKVWFENGLFHEEVWCYRQPRETISAESLADLMQKVNDEYGAE